jgi:hypothetical protein
LSEFEAASLDLFTTNADIQIEITDPATLGQSINIPMMIMKIDICADEEPCFHWN